VTRAAIVVVVVVAALATACSSSKPSSFAPDFPKPPSYDELVARAALDPCPPSSAAKTSKSLPDLTLPCLGKGPAVHLAGLSGTPTVVNIWGSWCGPCQAETKFLSTVYDAAHGKVRFLGVDTEDDAKSALDFAPHVSPPMRYPQVVDKNKRLLVGLNIPSSVPTTVFVSASGRVVRVSPGAYRSADALRADIARYLGVSV
jgi:cytochrome c biogenesis protein CcmG, thiol:disulfide interchange protein DsbE